MLRANNAVPLKLSLGSALNLDKKEKCMIHPLEAEEYKILRSMYHNLRFNLVVDSIIDGTTPAWVFVDQKPKPISALMWNKMDALLLAGYAENEAFNRSLGELLIQKVIPDAKSRYVPEMSLYCDSDAWESRLGLILERRRFQKASRRFYQYDQLKLDWRGQIPAGYEVKPINESLLESNEFGNMDQVMGWVRSFWRSHQDFAKKGIGYCLIKEKTIVSWCLSVYVSGTNFEFGVATMPEYLRQGLATFVAAACVEHCDENEFTPHWHCWNDNLGSIAVAERIGFEEPKTYYAYKFQLE